MSPIHYRCSRWFGKCHWTTSTSTGPDWHGPHSLPPTFRFQHLLIRCATYLSYGIILFAYKCFHQGNSLIRGPEDVILEIQRLLGSNTFDCSRPHNLTFQIGGKLFPVDPRDFIHQAFSDTVDLCTSALAITDPPGEGFLYSWSLGDPFLKS